MKRLATATSAIAIAAGLMTPVAAQASAPKPKLTIAAPTQVKAGVPATIKIKAKRVTGGTKVVLQKKAGAKWVQVKKLGRKGGTARVSTTVGTWKFRAAALKRGKAIATSRTITIRTVAAAPASYTVPLGALCQQATVNGTCGPGVIRVGYQDFRFQARLKVSGPFLSDVNDSRFTLRGATSCKSLTLQVAGDADAQEYGDSVTVAVRQAPPGQAPAGFAWARAGDIASITVPLAKAPFYLTTGGQNGQALLSGYATGCSTPTGVL